MCWGRVEAHDGSMFNTYEMTRALVAERQGTLRHEARQTRLARVGRRARKASGETKMLRLAAPVDPASPAGRSVEERLAA
jgi:hypothetical protein